MTLEEIKAIVLRADPTATRWEGVKGTDGAYTVWMPGALLPFTADGLHTGGRRFYIDRYTKDDGDPVVAQIFAVLDAQDAVAYAYEVDHGDGGYIHHIWTCEGA